MNVVESPIWVYPPVGDGEADPTTPVTTAVMAEKWL